MIYLGSDLSNAHQQLRYSALRNGGFLERATGLYRDESFKPSSYVLPLARTTNGSGYMRRMMAYIRVVLFLIRNRSSLYLYGPDIILISSIVNRVFRKRFLYIVEIADLHPIYIKRTLIRRVLFSFISQAQQVIVTSENFTSYFRSKTAFESTNFETIENKFHLKSTSVSAVSRPYDIGYFGLLRDEVSLRYLCELAENGVRILVAGKFIGISKEQIKKIECSLNIDFIGSYDYKDLASLYGRVKYSWSVYPITGNEVNRKLAWTNRYYESLALEVPIIIDKHSGDVTHFDKMMGIMLDFDNWEKAKKKILSLDDESRDVMVNYIARNKDKFRINIDHYKELYRCISLLE
jgi:hypothetical protein